MIRTERSVVTILVIASLCVVFLFNFLGGDSSKEEEAAVEVTSKKGVSSSSRSRERDYGVEETTDYCVWSPAEQEDCKRILSRRLLQHSGRIPPRRWLFLGDSTMAQIWKTSSLSQVLVDFGVSQMNEFCGRRYTCEAMVVQQCNLNQEYNLPVNAAWNPPQVGKEGPSNVTTANPREACLGCKNCISEYTLCKGIDDDRHCRANQKLIHGGYIAMPYARDVLLQTPKFATTQENILQDYIQHYWNSELLHEDYGSKPVCIVRTGVHDIAIPQMTTAAYVDNVQWYLQLLQTQCFHVIWLQNTAPLAHDTDQPPPQYPQTVERVREYDLAVYERIHQDSTLQGFVTTMDVFDVSKDWQHSDNIHLNVEWNRALGMFFVKLITKVGDR